MGTINNISVDGNGNIIVQNSNDVSLVINMHDTEQLKELFSRINGLEVASEEARLCLEELYRTYIYESFQTSITGDEFTDDINRLSHNFEGRDADKSFILTFANGDKGLLFVTGNAGIGKSSLAAQVYKDISTKDNNFHLITYFIKRNTPSAKAINFFAFLNEELEKIVKNERPIKSEINQLVADLRIRLKSIKSTNQKVVLLLDGLDEAESTDILSNLPTEMYENVVFIFFTRYTNEVDDKYTSAKPRGAELHPLQGLDQKTLQQIVLKIGEEFNLSESIQKQIVKNSQGNPKYLELLSLSIKNKSIIIDNDNAVIPLMPSSASGNDTNLFNDFYEPLFKKYAQNKEFGENIEDIIRVLTVAKDYLTIFQISNILQMERFTKIESSLPFIKDILLVKKYGQGNYDYHFQLLHESLREYINERYKVYLVKDKKRILTFCRSWKALLKDYKHLPSEIKYPFNYYSSHLKEDVEMYEDIESKEELFTLAFNNEFIDTQLKVLGEYEPSFELVQYAATTANKDKKYHDVALLGKQALRLHYNLSSEFKSLLMGIKSRDLEQLKKTISKINNRNKREQVYLFGSLLIYILVGEGKKNANKQEIIELIIDKIDIILNNAIPLSLIFTLLTEIKLLGFDITTFHNSVAAIITHRAIFESDKFQRFLDQINIEDENLTSITIDTLDAISSQSRKLGDNFVANVEASNSVRVNTLNSIYTKAIHLNIAKEFLEKYPKIQQLGNISAVDSAEDKSLNHAKNTLSMALGIVDFDNIDKVKPISVQKLRALEDSMKIILSSPDNEKLVYCYLKSIQYSISLAEESMYHYLYACKTLIWGVKLYPFLRPIVLHWIKNDYNGYYSDKYEILLLRFAEQVFIKGTDFDYESYNKIQAIFVSEYYMLSFHENFLYYFVKNDFMDFLESHRQEMINILNDYEQHEWKQRKEWEGGYKYMAIKMRLVSHICVLSYLLKNQEEGEMYKKTLFDTFTQFRNYFGEEQERISKDLGNGYDAFIGLFNYYDLTGNFEEATKIGEFIYAILEEFHLVKNISIDFNTNLWVETLFKTKNRLVYQELLLKSIKVLFVVDTHSIYVSKYTPTLLKEGYVIEDNLIQAKLEQDSSFYNNSFLNYAQLCFENKNYEMAYSYWEKYLLFKYQKTKINIAVCADIPNALLNQYFEQNDLKSASKFYKSHQKSLNENSYYTMMALYSAKNQEYEQAKELVAKSDYDTREGLYYGVAQSLLVKLETDKAIEFATLRVSGNDIAENLRVLILDAIRLKQLSTATHILDNYIQTPKDDSYIPLIIAFIQEKLWDSAFEYFNKLLNINYKDAEKVCDLGLFLIVQLFVNNQKENIETLFQTIHNEFSEEISDKNKINYIGKFISLKLTWKEWIESGVQRGLTHGKIRNLKRLLIIYSLYTFDFTKAIDIIKTEQDKEWCDDKYIDVIDFIMNYNVTGINMANIANNIIEEGKRQDTLDTIFKYYVYRNDIDNALNVFKLLSIENKADIPEYDIFIPNNTASEFIYNSLLSECNLLDSSNRLSLWKKLCNWAIWSDKAKPLFSELINKSIYNKEELGTICKVFAEYDSFKGNRLSKDYQNYIDEICIIN